jgi:hypothetical protein
MVIIIKGMPDDSEKYHHSFNEREISFCKTKSNIVIPLSSKLNHKVGHLSRTYSDSTGQYSS